MEIGTIVGLILFFIGILIGLPLCWVFVGSTCIALLILDLPMSFMAGTAYHAIDSYVLMAIAFFIFAGNMMSVSGIADRLTRFAYALVGRIRGGLVDVGIVATVFMGALTGSSLPCIAALIPILVPRLERLGYARAYVTGVLCSSSFLGYLIPPSVPALIYCLVAQQSVAAVFLSTVFPGLLLAGGYMLVNTLIVNKYYHETEEAPELPETFSENIKEIGSSFWSALPALGCPVLAFVGLFIYRDMIPKTLWKSALTTLVTLGMITLLLGFGTVFTRHLIRQGMGEALMDLVFGFSQNRYVVLALMNILLLVFGMFIDGIPILIIVVPLILPLVTKIDVNLVHLGAMIIVNVGLGVVTPPYAISIFVGSKLADVPYIDLVKPMMIFLLFVGIPVLLMTTYWPALSCWLPTVVLGPKIVGAW